MQSSAEILALDHPVVALKDEYPSGFVDPMHSHDAAQLLFAIGGVMAIKTAEKAVVIPPQRALIIPAGMQHEVSCRGAVSLRTIYFKAGELVDMLDSQVLEVTELVKALIVTISEFDAAIEWGEREERIIRLLVEEVGELPHAPYSVSMPRDPRLVLVCQSLLDDPSNGMNIDYWADMAAMGRRTFTRAFRRETGVGFAVWRQQVRLMAALSLLAEGQSITRTAYDVGYDSPSGFAMMFRRAFGVSPSQYME